MTDIDTAFLMCAILLHFMAYISYALSRQFYNDEISVDIYILCYPSLSIHIHSLSLGTHITHMLEGQHPTVLPIQHSSNYFCAIVYRFKNRNI